MNGSGVVVGNANAGHAGTTNDPAMIPRTKSRRVDCGTQGRDRVFIPSGPK